MEGCSEGEVPRQIADKNIYLFDHSGQFTTQKQINNNIKTINIIKIKHKINNPHKTKNKLRDFKGKVAEWAV